MIAAVAIALGMTDIVLLLNDFRLVPGADAVQIGINVVAEATDDTDSGADDYLTKPFALGELLARIRSLTRRNEDFSPKNLTIADVTLDVEQQEIRAQNAIRLAPKEAKLLEYLLQNVGKDVSTKQIFERIWKDDQEADIGLVWVYISYLRQKLNAITGKLAIEGDEGGSYRIHERVSA